MYKVNKFRFFLYIGVICNLFSSRKVEMFGRMVINIIFFVVLWVFVKTLCYVVKYGGEILFYERVDLVVFIVILFIRLSFIFAVFVKRIRLGICKVIIYDYV